MSARVEGLSFPHHPLRRLFGPALGLAVVATLLAKLRQRALKPSMPRMSEQWLLSHAKEFNRLDY
jgi:hypothetical protein